MCQLLIFLTIPISFTSYFRIKRNLGTLFEWLFTYTIPVKFVYLLSMSTVSYISCYFPSSSWWWTLLLNSSLPYLFNWIIIIPCTSFHSQNLLVIYNSYILVKPQCIQEDPSLLHNIENQPTIFSNPEWNSIGVGESVPCNVTW